MNQSPGSQSTPRVLPTHPKPPRSVRVLTPTYWAAVAVVVLVFLNELIAGRWQIFFETQWIPYFLCLGVALIFAHRFIRRSLARNFLSKHRGFICPRCHYALTTLPDVGLCPECGTSYTRSDVVVLWENEYGLENRFPRNSPTRPPSEHAAFAAPIAQASMPPTHTSWTNASLNHAVQQAEAAARARGFNAMRFPIYANELEAVHVRLGRQLPGDLFAFYAWFDHALWSTLISQGVDTAPNSLAWTDQSSDGPADDWIRVRPPSQLTPLTLEALASTRPSVAFFLDHLHELHRPQDWRSALVFEFADTCDGSPVLFCIEAPGEKPGCLITFRAANTDRVWLANSIAEWLARLAACAGCDPALDPRLFDRLDPASRAAFKAEQEQHNQPSSTLPTPPVA